MSSKKQKPFLVVLDVGHGNAAVLHDEGGTVVFDTGKGATVGRHLQQLGIKKVQALFLSHADEDHIGGAVTLLLAGEVQIAEVFMNSDATKQTLVFEQLRYALAEANVRHGTKIDRRLATSTSFPRMGISIEVLHPPDAIVMSGVGGKPKGGRKLTSNSMSAAIRISRGAKSSVLLGGDIEYDCLDGWKAKAVQPTAAVLVFPHHGGLPDTSDSSEAELFAFELTKLVCPEVVIFSNHRTKFNKPNPRDEILTAISKASGTIQLVCTQLPQRLHPNVKVGGQWSLHKSPTGAGIVEGSICLEFQASGIQVTFGERP